LENSIKKVLITGGAGYIGSHVADLLVQSGYKVRIFDDFSNGLRQRVDGIFDDIFEGDITDKQAVLKALGGIDSVIHLAGKKSVKESVLNPIKYYFNNVSGTISLLSAMYEANVNRIIFSSSAAVYAAKDGPIEENDLTTPSSPYGNSKLIAENLISDASKSCGLSAISLRYFNVVGASKPEFADNSKDNLLPKVFAAYNQNRKPEIYGNKYHTKDGTCVRDYIDVRDLAQAHLASLHKIENVLVNEIYNVGSGVGYSVKEMMDQISKSIKTNLDPVNSDPRPGDAPILVASIKKIQGDLGWYPKYNLSEMVDSSWNSKIQRR
jgi:UDP-glucose 4-epimerase